jgi:hypothetical protein
LTVFPRLDFDYLEVSLRLMRVAAIKEMFDRGFGKATQPVEGSLTYGISNQLAELFRGNERNTLGAEIARRAARPAAALTSHGQVHSDCRLSFDKTGRLEKFSGHKDASGNSSHYSARQSRRRRVVATPISQNSKT